jgi:hypothetical protein
MSGEPSKRAQIRVGLIGADIQMSKSSALHEREAAAQGLDYPADVEVPRTDRAAADDHRRGGGIVGDGVGDRARDLAPVVDDLHCRHYELRRSHDVVDADVRHLQDFAHHEGELNLQAGC